MPMLSPRRPLGALSLNRAGQAKGLSKIPKKHQSKASLEIGKDGRASISISNPYPSAKTRARAATICQRTEKERRAGVASLDQRNVRDSLHAKRQSTTAAESDDVEALIAKYTALNDEELLVKARSPPVFFPVSSQMMAAPMLAAPTMERSALVPQSTFQPFQRPLPDPFPYAPLLEQTASPFLHLSPSMHSSLASTPSSSLFSSLSSGKSVQITEVSAAPIEKLGTIIHNLQELLPRAAAVPQYKLDNLQQSVDLLLYEESGHAPSTYQYTTSFNAPSSYPLAMQLEGNEKTGAQAEKVLTNLQQHAPQSLIFVYEDGRGKESHLPTW
ncbi:MAG: hypothetical protein CYPHOPRED_001492 [Cyphobasidiales sp. Tagirdzhanova-0007]|nr:MAG: hypothetical protein CYPHOPRED_001492 [Cyphobasidiales sp. Tagirdzhanova-0007]